MTKTNIRNLIYCAIFAALTAVCSQISFPLPFTPVPINLALLAVILAGGILGPKWGAISQIVYLAVGSVGLPVFANLKGGIGVLLGPTGGYIIGYIAAAWLTGILLQRSNRGYFFYVVSMAAGIAGCYLFGTAWYMFLTKSGLIPALTMCVVPFLIGDILKIAAASVLAKKLFPVLSKNLYRDSKLTV